MGAGLPFAGIPPELTRRIDIILEKEPEHPEIAVDFSHARSEGRPPNLARLLAPHWLALSLAVVLVVVETVTVQAGPLLAKFGIDRGIARGDLAILLLVSALYAGALLLNAAVVFLRIAWTGRLAEGLTRTLRIRVFAHLQRLSMDYYTEQMGGRLMSRMTSDIEALSTLLQEGFVNLLVQGLTLVLVTAVLFALNAELATILLLCIAPPMLVLTLWFRRASGSGYAVVRERIADVLADFQENLNGIAVVKAFNRQRRNIAHHFAVLGDYRNSNFHTVQVAAIFDSGSMLISIAGQTLILFVGGRMYLAGTLTIGELTAFVLYLSSFYAPIHQLVQLFNVYQRGQAALHKLRELLEDEPTVQEAPGARELPPIRGELTLEKVGFSYRSGTEVLEEVELSIAPGETIAVVGQTGAGKSTVAKLVTRFHDPTAGRILIDGIDIREVTFDSLRRQLGYVPQEPFLFAGTIRDNVAFARPGATDDEVREACRTVGVSDLIEQKPGGIHYRIHERGSSLSSGERQLIALARAFLAQPRIVVLDEATSNLDLASESRVQHALDVLLQGRTAVIIAHRLTTAMRADRIALFHRGRLVETGSHRELLSRGGRYAEMYAAWARHARDSRPG